MRVAILALAALLFAAPGSAQTQRKMFVAGNWAGVAHFSKTGRFSSCSMAARYRSGTSLYFWLSRDAAFRVAFANPKWMLKTGSRHKLTFLVDGRRVLRAEGTVVGERGADVILVELPTSTTLFQHLRKGYVLRVSAPHGRMGFSLAGTAVALSRLVRCVSTRIAKRAAPQDADNPFAAAPGRDDGSRRARRSTAPSSERVQALTMIANMLSRAGVAEYEIVPLDEIPEKWRAYHAIWRAGETVGFARLYRDLSAKTRRTLYSQMIARDFEACGGSYQSGVKRRRETGRAISFFSRCLGKEGWSYFYVLIGPDKAGFTYLVGLFSPDRNKPLALGVKLRAALSAIVLREEEPPRPEQKRKPNQELQ